MRRGLKRLSHSSKYEEECILEMEHAIDCARKRLIDFTTFTMPRYEVNWHHELICDTIDRLVARDISRLIVCCPPRFGKLIADRTPVLTCKGWVTHGDLKRGDYVFHPSGKPVRVVALSRKGRADMDMCFNNGETISCHGAHEWRVFDRAAKAWNVCEAQDLARNRHNGLPAMLMSGNTGKKRCRYMMPIAQALYLPSQELPCHPYALGAWLGDGTKGTAKLNMQACDNPIIEAIAACGYKISSVTTHPTTGVVGTAFYGNPRAKNKDPAGNMSLALQAAGVFNNKHIPHIYLFSSKKQRMQLLAGLVDTDGYVCKETGRVKIINTRPDIVKGVLHLATTLGWRPYFTRQEPVTSSSGIVGRLPVYAVGFQPTEALPTMLARKKLKIFAKQRRVGLARIRKRKTALSGHCIQVDSPDGMYLVGRTMIPTHNSEIVSRRLPAYLLGRFPDQSIVAASYSQDLASKNNRDTQRIMTQQEYRMVFPATQIPEAKTPLPAEGSWLRNTEEFEVVGRRGVYKCAGVGTGLTGRGGNAAILDDVIKNRMEAESPTVRRNIWDWYTSTLYTRLEKDAVILITMTRWHPSDIVGRLLELQKNDPDADRWEVLSLPAIAEKDGHPKDPRSIDEVLWEEKYSRKVMMRIKANNIRDWTSMYQQRPAPEDGDIFNRKWWRYYQALPGDLVGHIMTVDGTFKDKEQNDFAVLQVWAKRKSAPAELYLVDQTRARMGYIALKAAFIALCAKHPAVRAKYVEDTVNGVPLIEELKGSITGIIAVTPKGSKIARAQAISPTVQSGNVFLPQDAPWVADFVSEASAFPNGKHDDQIDCLSMAIARLTQAKASTGRARAISLTKQSQWGGHGMMR